MKIYYYHTRPIREALQEWREFKHPGHILYGLTHFEKYGIESILHPYKYFSSRFKMMLYNLWQILFCKERYDVLYGTSFRGLELIIFLRAFGFYRKPIVIWHHTAVVSSPNKLKNGISRFFYRGIDQMFLFSERLIEDSLQTGKVAAEKMQLIHWGADLDFYNHLLETEQLQPSSRFISTGKENRDFQTLLSAFSKTDARLSVFTPPVMGNLNQEAIFQKYASKGSNIQVNYVGGIIPHQLAKEVAQSSAVVISCLKFPYTVGLTTLVEAFALGLPVITTDNPWFNMHVEEEGAGLCVDYSDEDGWIKAIHRIQNNPEMARTMGHQGKKLAENTYNLDNFTREMSETILRRFSLKK